MGIYAKTIVQASKTILANKNYRLALFILILLIFFLLISILVNIIPSNDFKTQFSLYKSRDYFMLAAVSFLVSLLLLMHVYNFKRMRQARERAGDYALVVLGVLQVRWPSVFGAATCPMSSSAVVNILQFML